MDFRVEVEWEVVIVIATLFWVSLGWCWNCFRLSCIANLSHHSKTRWCPIEIGLEAHSLGLSWLHVMGALVVDLGLGILLLLLLLSTSCNRLVYFSGSDITSILFLSNYLNEHAAHFFNRVFVCKVFDFWKRVIISGLSSCWTQYLHQLINWS